MISYSSTFKSKVYIGNIIAANAWSILIVASQKLTFSTEIFEALVFQKSMKPQATRCTSYCAKISRYCVHCTWWQSTLSVWCTGRLCHCQPPQDVYMKVCQRCTVFWRELFWKQFVYINNTGILHWCIYNILYKYVTNRMEGLLYCLQAFPSWLFVYFTQCQLIDGLCLDENWTKVRLLTNELKAFSDWIHVHYWQLMTKYIYFPFGNPCFLFVFLLCMNFLHMNTSCKNSLQYLVWMNYGLNFFFHILFFILK